MRVSTDVLMHMPAGSAMAAYFYCYTHVYSHLCTHMYAHIYKHVDTHVHIQESAVADAWELEDARLSAKK